MSEEFLFQVLGMSNGGGGGYVWGAPTYGQPQVKPSSLWLPAAVQKALTAKLGFLCTVSYDTGTQIYSIEMHTLQFSMTRDAVEDFMSKEGYVV